MSSKPTTIWTLNMSAIYQSRLHVNHLLQMIERKYISISTLRYWRIRNCPKALERRCACWIWNSLNVRHEPIANDLWTFLQSARPPPFCTNPSTVACSIAQFSLLLMSKLFELPRCLQFSNFLSRNYLTDVMNKINRNTSEQSWNDYRYNSPTSILLKKSTRSFWWNSDEITLWF